MQVNRTVRILLSLLKLPRLAQAWRKPPLGAHISNFFGLNPCFETNGNGTLCRERNCQWRGDERDGIRTSFVEWRSSD